MANASAKRIAAQNEISLRNLRYGMIAFNALYFLLRLFLPYRQFPPTISQLALYILTLLPSLLLFFHLSSLGLPRREPSTGALISAGEDLSAAGVIEWCWDVVYVTWSCQILTSLFGEWFWLAYLIIPGYAFFKLYSSFIGPILAGRLSSSSDTQSGSADGDDDTLSKRQAKMKKRSEKGEQVKVKRR